MTSLPAAERIVYRPADVIRLTGLGRSTIYAAIAEGRLESYKLGASRLIPADALESYLRGGVL
jgi:excisionase family DNA binding protein